MAQLARPDRSAILPFKNRQQAGRLLAAKLASMNLLDTVVLALPRGGVPVGLEVARRLHAPLDLLLSRKIGVPGNPELAMAAVVEGSPPEVVVDEGVMEQASVSKDWMDAAVAREVGEIKRRREVYLRGRPAEALNGRTVIVVDDGMATGTTMRAAISALQRVGAKRLIVAVPLAPAGAVVQIMREVDDVVCLAQPACFNSIGMHYDDFHQLGDEEVIDLIDQAWSLKQSAAPLAGSMT